MELVFSLLMSGPGGISFRILITNDTKSLQLTLSELQAGVFPNYWQYCTFSITTLLEHTRERIGRAGIRFRRRRESPSILKKKLIIIIVSSNIHNYVIIGMWRVVERVTTISPTMGSWLVTADFELCKFEEYQEKIFRM